MQSIRLGHMRVWTMQSTWNGEPIVHKIGLRENKGCVEMKCLMYIKQIQIYSKPIYMQGKNGLVT